MMVKRKNITEYIIQVNDMFEKITKYTGAAFLDEKLKPFIGSGTMDFYINLKI